MVNNFLLAAKGTLLSLFFAFSLSAWADADYPIPTSLTPYSFIYSTDASGINFDTETTLTQKQNKYILTQSSDTTLAGTTSFSRFFYDASGMRLDYFNYTKTIFGSKSTETNRFYPDKGIATYQKKGDDVETFDMPELLYDKLNYLLALREDLIQHQGELKATQYPVAERKRIKTYEYKSHGTEWVETDNGYFLALKIERVRSKSTRSTFIWLATDWDYHIIKVQHIEDGDPDYTMVLKSGEINGSPIKGLSSPPSQAAKK